MDEWIKEPLCECTMECCSAFTEKEVLPFAMNLEDIMLSEISQTQKEEYMTLHANYRKKVKYMEAESRPVVAKA